MKIKKGFSTTSLPTLLSRRVRQFSRSFEALFLFYSVVDVHVSDRKKYRTDPNSSSFYYYIFPEASDTPKNLVNWHCVHKTFFLTSLSMHRLFTATLKPINFLFWLLTLPNRISSDRPASPDCHQKVRISSPHCTHVAYDVILLHSPELLGVHFLDEDDDEAAAASSLSEITFFFFIFQQK